MTTKTAATKKTAAASKRIIVQCNECQHRWKVSPNSDPQCKKCNSADVEPAVDQRPKSRRLKTAAAAKVQVSPEELTLPEAQRLDALTVVAPSRFEDEVQVAPKVETFPQEAPTLDEVLAQPAWIAIGGSLSERETALLQRLYTDPAGVTVTRKSEREFDLGITGPGFRSWLPLAAIHAMDWTSERIAARTEYPEMTASGDWFGVRDSSRGAKWTIFEAEIDAFLGPDAKRKAARRAESARRTVEAKAPAVAPKRVTARAAKKTAAKKAPAKKVAAQAAQPTTAPKGRALVLGLPAAPLGRWMGSRGWTIEQAAAVLGKFGVTLGERSLSNLLSEGRNAAKRAAAGIKEVVASPDPKQAKELEAARPFAQ